MECLTGRIDVLSSQEFGIETVKFVVSNWQLVDESS